MSTELTIKQLQKRVHAVPGQNTPCKIYHCRCLQLSKWLPTREVPELPPLDGVQAIEDNLYAYIR